MMLREAGLTYERDKARTEARTFRRSFACLVLGCVLALPALNLDCVQDLCDKVPQDASRRTDDPDWPEPAPWWGRE